MFSAICRYLNLLAFWTSAGRCEPARKREKGYDSVVPAASPMSKLAKKMEKIRKSIVYTELRTFSLWGFFFILEFLLDFWKDNFVMSATESFLPYQRPILRYFWRDNISDPRLVFDFPYQRPIPLFRVIVLRCGELRDPWMNIL